MVMSPPCILLGDGSAVLCSAQKRLPSQPENAGTRAVILSCGATRLDACAPALRIQSYAAFVHGAASPSPLLSCLFGLPSGVHSIRPVPAPSHHRLLSPKAVSVCTLLLQRFSILIFLYHTTRIWFCQQKNQRIFIEFAHSRR